MASRRKTSAKTKTGTKHKKKAPARKPAARSKPATKARKKAAAKKTAARRAPAKKAKAGTKAKTRPVARPAATAPAIRPAAPAPRPVAPAIRPAPAATKPPITLPAHPGMRIGVVTHYFGHLSVAVIKIEQGTLRVGDAIHIKGHTTDFNQRVQSLQVEHQPVSEVGRNDDFGIKVTDHVREGDVVYKV
ncbi:MAG TPA: EF-Tu/IF-2/RF-3 family GTPase [Burkholderiales bacterium]|nr:EF-Tu/IF-2/RF-3 family GTPase [Burkholderiales bacterium]